MTQANYSPENISDDEERRGFRQKARNNFNYIQLALNAFQSWVAQAHEEIKATIIKPAIRGGFAINDVRYYGTLANAVATIPSGSEQTLYITNAQTLATDLTIPSYISLVVLKGGSIDGSHTLTVNGPFEAGRYRIFGSSLTVSFSVGSAEWIFPQWRKQATDPDDTNSLVWAFGLPNNQYDTPGVSLGSMEYHYTQTLIINKQVLSAGAVLIPEGPSNMAGFKLASNAALAAATSNTGVDCTILITDGGGLSNCTIFLTAGTIDNSGNAGVFLVNLQENYGKKPLYDCRINGYQTGKYLNGVAVRYNTTCNFHEFGGDYFSNGLVTFNNNNCDFGALFFENIRNSAGNKAFYFNSIGECSIHDCWAEQGGDLVNGFYFESCGDMKGVWNLKLGECPTHGPGVNDWLNGIYVTGCSDIPFYSLSTTGLRFAHATAYVVASSRIGMDDTYDAKRSGYGQIYLIENHNYKPSGFPVTVGLDETFREITVGKLPYGTVLTVYATSNSGAIVTAAIDVYRLSGGVLSNRGTVNLGSISNAGDRVSGTFNIDTSAHYILTPSTRYTLTFIAGGYVSAIAGDIGKPVIGGTSAAGAYLLSYDNAARTWLVAIYSGAYTPSEAITITAGTGAGTLAAVSHAVAYNPFVVVDLDWDRDLVNGNAFI